MEQLTLYPNINDILLEQSGTIGLQYLHSCISKLNLDELRLVCSDQLANVAIDEDFFYKQNSIIIKCLHRFCTQISTLIKSGLTAESKNNNKEYEQPFRELSIMLKFYYERDLIDECLFRTMLSLTNYNKVINLENELKIAAGKPQIAIPVSKIDFKRDVEDPNNF